jgi:hypothetical protein
MAIRPLLRVTEIELAKVGEIRVSLLEPVYNESVRNKRLCLKETT